MAVIAGLSFLVVDRFRRDFSVTRPLAAWPSFLVSACCVALVDLGFSGRTEADPSVSGSPSRRQEMVMKLNLFKSKIHRATVTQADLSYEGSVTIDQRLMAAAEILPYEAVHIWNVTNGQRLVTYALPGAADSGVVCINGAAAHHHRPGDTVILATFAEFSPEEARSHKPRVVRVDSQNRLVAAHLDEVPGPLTRTVRDAGMLDHSAPLV
jgi:aspartate 1-decarboxylase